jgi:hypothetical protein
MTACDTLMTECIVETTTWLWKKPWNQLRIAADASGIQIAQRLLCTSGYLHLNPRKVSDKPNHTGSVKKDV